MLEIWKLVSLTTPQHKHVQTRSIVYVHPSCNYLTFCDVIHLISGFSVCVGALFQDAAQAFWQTVGELVAAWWLRGEC